MNTLSRYFSPEVAQDIVESENLTISGRSEAAVLFCDIRDFTLLSESMPVDELRQFLTDFRREITQCIWNNHGIVDKFPGDGILAVFGVPRPIPDSRSAAVRAARETTRRLTTIRGPLLKKPDLRIGIGIHYGPVFAGTVGEDSQLEYTVIGDTVNTASRIEGQCKDLGQTILISAGVLPAIPPGEIAAEYEVTLRGKSTPVRLYAMQI